MYGLVVIENNEHIMEATETEWEFLQPWIDALRNRVTLYGTTSPPAYVLGDLDYWSYPQDEFPVAIDTFSLVLAFPADEASRKRDRILLQKVREALELFTILAAADNSAFVQVLSEFLNKGKLIVDDEAGSRPHLVLPNWKCWLHGRLSESDPVASQSSITWGDLYGCPEDPDTYSVEFRAAKERILLAGGEIRHELGFVRSSVQWRVVHEVLGMVGEQKKSSKASTETAEAYVPDLGELFDVEVPAVVLMNAFSSKSLPINTWKSPLPQDTMSSTFETRGTIHKLRVMGRSTGRIMDSIARTAMTRLELILDDRGIDQSTLGLAIESKGFLYSSLFCGFPICRLHGANLNYHALKHQCRIKRLDLSGYEWASDNGIGAIYSAIAEAQTVEKLKVDPECDLLAENDRETFEGPMSQAHWCWLAYALWSKASKLSIRKLTLGAITLTDEDVSAIEAVLQTGYPEPVSQRSGSNESQLPQYGYVNVPAGAEVVPVDSESTVLVMTNGYRCRALFDPSTMDNHLNAVIPGYGICKVKLKDDQSLFMGEPPLPPGVLRTATVTFRDLNFDCVDLECGEVMTRLLSLIGGNLRSLRVRNGEQNENMVDLDALAGACPMLEELYVHEFNVLVVFQGKALLKSSIKRLIITGSNLEPRLASFLSHPASLMTRQLVELKVFCGRAYPRDERDYYRFSPGYVEELKEHDGDFLPVVKEKFPIASKIAMISVVVRCDDITQTRWLATRYFDSVLLGMIFAFAATPERRSVLVNSTKAQMEEDGIKD